MSARRPKTLDRGAGRQVRYVVKDGALSGIGIKVYII